MITAIGFSVLLIFCMLMLGVGLFGAFLSANFQSKEGFGVFGVLAVAGGTGLYQLSQCVTISVGM